MAVSKIIYENYVPPVAQEQPKPDRLPPVGYHLKQAALAGGAIAFTLFIIAMAIYPANWIYYARIAAAIGVFIFGWYCWKWIPRVAIYDWERDRSERERRQKIEDEARYGNAPIPTESDGITKSERLELVCWRILRMHYYQRLQATRPQCERVGITQPEWNAANRLLQLVGLKGERGWVDLPAVDAFERFETCTRFDQDSVYYRPTESAASLIRFFAENTETET